MNQIKVLLVDDEADILEFLSYTLIENNFSVETATNGLNAIKQYEKFQPDIIIMDVMMPEMDGIAACEK